MDDEVIEMKSKIPDEDKRDRGDNLNMEEENPERRENGFYKQNWFILLSLFFFAPLGIFLMCRYGKWNKYLKTAAAVLACLWFIFVIFSEYPPEAESSNADTDISCSQTNTEKETYPLSAYGKKPPLTEEYISASAEEKTNEKAEKAEAEIESGYAAIPSAEKPAPSQTHPPQTGNEYALNTNTKVYHRPECRYVKTIKEENYLLSSAVPPNYRPCKVCKP